MVGFAIYFFAAISVQKALPKNSKTCLCADVPKPRSRGLPAGFQTGAFSAGFRDNHAGTARFERAYQTTL
jgi:hypothetical protein